MKCKVPFYFSIYYIINATYLAYLRCSMSLKLTKDCSLVVSAENLTLCSRFHQVSRHWLKKTWLMIYVNSFKRKLTRLVFVLSVACLYSLTNRGHMWTVRISTHKQWKKIAALFRSHEGEAVAACGTCRKLRSIFTNSVELHCPFSLVSFQSQIDKNLSPW